MNIKHYEHHTCTYQCDPTFDLKIKVGNCDPYVMVQDYNGLCHKTLTWSSNSQIKKGKKHTKMNTEGPDRHL